MPTKYLESLRSVPNKCQGEYCTDHLIGLLFLISKFLLWKDDHRLHIGTIVKLNWIIKILEVKEMFNHLMEVKLFF